GNGGHEVIIHPRAAHGVMDGGIDAHRRAIGVFPRDFLVHVEEVAVTLADNGLAQPLDRIGKIKVHSEPAWADAAASVADFFGSAGRNVARRKVSKARVFAFQIVITVVFRNGSGRFGAIFFAFWHPDAAIVAERFGH